MKLRNLMIAVALLAVLLGLGVWAFPRKHHRVVSVNKTGISWITYHFDTDRPDDLAEYEALVARLRTAGRPFLVHED